jgi:hypothetical protein
MHNAQDRVCKGRKSSVTLAMESLTISRKGNRSGRGMVVRGGMEIVPGKMAGEVLCVCGGRSVLPPDHPPPLVPLRVNAVQREAAPHGPSARSAWLEGKERASGVSSCHV